MNSIISPKGIAAALATGLALYSTYRFFFSKTRARQPLASDAQIASYRARLLSSHHWDPLVAYAADAGFVLKPPAGKPDGPSLPPEPYNWAFVARMLNFLAEILPESMFMSQANLLKQLDKALIETPVVDCLGGQRGNEIVNRRMKRWISQIKWDQLSGVGRVMVTERVGQWLTERRNFHIWYRDNWHLIVDAEGNDLKPFKPSLVIVGAPRSGTTLLQSLLSVAPEARSPRLFESTIVTRPSTKDAPFPPTAPDQLKSDSRLKQLLGTLKQADAVFGPEFLGRIAASHPTVADPYLADEDTLFLWSYGLSPQFDYLTAGAIDPWADTVEASDEHKEATRLVALSVKRFYQMLGVGFEPSQVWVGKAPHYAQLIPAMAEVFPDAHFVMPMRAAHESVASYCRTQEAIISGLLLKNDSPLADRRLLGRWTARDVWAMRNVGVSDKFVPKGLENRFIRVQYEDLLKDPVGTVTEIHAKAGLRPPSQGHVDAIAKFLKETPQGRHGRNTYSLQEYGLEEDDLEPEMFM